MHGEIFKALLETIKGDREANASCVSNILVRGTHFFFIFVEKLYYSLRNLILRKLSLRAMLCSRESILNMKTYDRDTAMEE